MAAALRAEPAVTRATTLVTAAATPVATPVATPRAPRPSLPVPAVKVGSLEAFSKISLTLLPIRFERSTTIPQIKYEKLTIMAVTINFGKRRLIP